MSGVADSSSTYLTEMTSNSIAVGYKKTEVGMIPEDWEIFSLGQLVAKTQLGGNYKNSERDTGQPLIKMGNLGRGFVKLSKQEFVIGNASESDLLNYGDVLFNTRNTLELVGKVAIWKNELPKAYFNSNLMRISFKEDLVSSNLFMNALMNSERLIKALSDIAIGTTSVAAIYNRDLFLIKVALPTREEQTAIANALSDVDALISELEKLIAKKQAIKTATMQQLLTGRTRLPQFALRDDGTPKGTKPSELGEIPEDWEVDLLRSVCDSFKTGKLDANAMKPDGEYRFYTCAKEYYYIDRYAFDEEALMVSGNGANVGYVHYYKGKFNAYQRTYVLSNFIADVIYLKIYLERKLAERIRVEVNAGNTPYITMDTLTDMPIVLPPKEEQIAIATILSDMDAEIQALEQRLGKTRQIKQGMMQELLTGRTRLPFEKEQ